MKNQARWAVGAAVVLLLGALLWRGIAGDGAPGQGLAPQAPGGPAASASGARPALTVTTTTPQRVQWPVAVPANGTIAAWQEAIVGAEAQGLRLVELVAGVGDRVQRGQLLARLQSDTLSADLAVTRASLGEAQAALVEAQANAERARLLQPSGAFSAQQSQQYYTAEASARARVAALEAQLKAGEVRLAQTRILAPDDGLISARSATLGSVVAPGQELFRLIRQQRLEWRAELPADELARIKPGMAVTLTPAGGTAVAGRVRMVAPTVDVATRNGLVYVDIAAGSAARAGMFARGEFAIGQAAALTLPQGAVVLRDGFAYVFRVGPDARVQQTKVGVGRRSGERIEVTAGLDDSATVALQGVGFLSDGDLVRVVATPASAGR